MNKSYKINLKNVVWGTINKKTLLVKIPTNPNIYACLDSLNKNVFELKGVSLEIWTMLIQNYNSQKILRRLVKKYGSHKKQIQRNFRKFIEQLKTAKIIDEIH